MNRTSSIEQRPSLELVAVVGETMTVVPLPTHGAVTLGRAKDCEVRIDNGSVSRWHAVLHLGPPLRIQDLGSANGTVVREARSLTDTATTYSLRKLSKETIEIGIGVVVNLGSIQIVVRQVVGTRQSAVVCDPAMQVLHKEVTRVARSTISVLLLGETGVGKEVLARALHECSPRAKKGFVEINCEALPLSLLEAELFGYEKNAFTDAKEALPGLLESADGGTVFLDEIGDFPAQVQVKLLRVLEDRKVMRIGSRKPKELDVRFVAATNRNLETEVERGNFRQDLFFRINGVSFVVPPLRERVTEIEPLAKQFLAVANEALNRLDPLILSSEALKYLERYAWRGNVRELRNVIERAAVLCSGNAILPVDLPTEVTANKVPDHTVGAQPKGYRAIEQVPLLADAADEPKWSQGDAAERQRIIDALARCSGNQTRAAKQLGMSLRKLVSLLDKYELPRPRKQG